MLSVSERLSSIKLKAPFQFLDGSFLFTQEYHKNTLASCTTSVYVNLSKNSFFFRSRPGFLGESGCKGTAFFRTAKTFQEKISVYRQKTVKT